MTRSIRGNIKNPMHSVYYMTWYMIGPTVAKLRSCSGLGMQRNEVKGHFMLSEHFRNLSNITFV